MHAEDWSGRICAASRCPVIPIEGRASQLLNRATLSYGGRLLRRDSRRAFWDPPLGAPGVGPGSAPVGMS